MAKRKLFVVPGQLHLRYIIAFVIGILVGMKVIPVPVTAVLYLVLIVVCLYKCLRGDVSGYFSILPYAVYTEIFVRGFARWVPYLMLEYVSIASFIILFFTAPRLKKPHSHSWFMLVLYMFVEVANNIYPDKKDIGRAILTNSFSLLIPVVWASFNVLKPVVINKLLNNIKVASVYLAGAVVVAHFTSKINYGLFSNAESSNGLAPVQLSGYLGLGCILFFLSIVNLEEARNKTINMIMLSITATVMVLTFSRGGLYFIAAVVVLYLYFNRQHLARFAQLLVIVPVAIGIYFYVVSQTGGKIVERYEMEGTSSRDVLVELAFQQFSRHLIFGIGTGNFNTTIVREGLYPEQSGVHNEFARAAAEHGIIGIFFYWGFYVLLFLEILRRRPTQKQYALYFFVLFCLIIVHNGLKISIQPLLIMIVIATPSLNLPDTYAIEADINERRAA